MLPNPEDDRFVRDTLRFFDGILEKLFEQSDPIIG